MATYVAGETISGTLSVDGRGTPFRPFANKPFNTFLDITGTITATLQRSFDEGTTWYSVPMPDLSGPAAFSADTNFMVDEAQASTIYAWLASGTAGGTAAYRFAT